MVFEQLFKARWAYKWQHAFLLGFVYALIGIASARMIFAASSGIMSVAFTSILLIPSLAELLRIETNQELETSKFSIKRLAKDHADIFEMYIFLFLGVFIAYSIATLLFPLAQLEQLFSQQLRVAGIRGYAVVDAAFVSLLLNNILVFSVSFILSLIYGAGAVIFLVWNASVWGVVFSYFVKRAAVASGASPIISFLREVIPFMPHMITEGAAYIGAAIVGGIVSKAVLREKPFSKKFNHVMTDALIFLVLGLILVLVAGIIEVKWFARL